MANHYDIPKWAGKPPIGYHLDVAKDGKLIQKLMVDEKKCYLFGRNPQLNDFCIDHASCSRIHSSLVYHKHLNRAFLVDLGSTHGTYIGSVRIESNKPTQLPVDSQFHFGASTRFYTLRERPQPLIKPSLDDKSTEDTDSGLVGLPETEKELDNLTEFNTAHNRRISMLGIVDEEVRPFNRNRKKKFVIFNDEEEIINPEDIDPTVGRFRNLVQMTVVPTKKRKLESGLMLSDSHSIMHRRLHLPLSYSNDLYSDLPGPTGEIGSSGAASFMFSSSLTHKLGLNLPNPAPDVEREVAPIEAPPTVGPLAVENMALEPKKKKYAKEAWPGKKPNPSLLI